MSNFFDWLSSETFSSLQDTQVSYAKFLELCERPESERTNSELKYSICRNLISWLGKFCRVDMSFGLRANCEVRSSKATHKQQKSRWPFYVQILSYLCTISMLINLFCQYVFDYHFIRLRRFRMASKQLKEHIAFVELNQTSLDAAERILEQRLAGQEQVLDLIGAPLRNAHFLHQSVLLSTLPLTFFLYIWAPHYFDDRKHPLDFYLMRLMLDKQSEFVYCYRIIQHEAQLFVCSSLNNLYDCIQMRYINLSAETFLKASKNFKISDFKKLSRENGLRRNVEDHIRSVEIISQLIRNGELIPENRYYRITETAINQIILFGLVLVTYLICFCAGFFFLFPRYIVSFELSFSAMDIVSCVELTILSEITLLAITFYVILYPTSCYIQIVQFKLTINKLRKCIELNELRRDKLKLLSCKQSETILLIDEMNRDFLHAILLYKVFKSQFKLARTVIQFGISSIIPTVFIITAAVRINLPYLTVLEIQPGGAHFFFILAAIGLLAIGDTILVAACVIHQLSLQLYKLLNSLLVHSVKSNSIYYEHSIRFLRQELSHPDEVINQFSMEVFGQKLTFPLLVEYHYYYSLISISASVEIGTIADFLGNRLYDPLGLYG